MLCGSALLVMSFPSLRHTGKRRGAHSPARANLSSCAPRNGVRNPVFSLPQGRVRDPAVVALKDSSSTSVSYELYFTNYRGNPAAMFSGSSAKFYTVRVVRTSDWQVFSEPSDVTPPGFASPDAPVTWRNSTILAFQAYPDKSLGGKYSGLYFSRRSPRAANGRGWSRPKPFLQDALRLPWNSAKRAIDPTLIVDSHDQLHCFFVGSAWIGSEDDRRRANLLGHAVTDDPELKR